MFKKIKTIVVLGLIVSPSFAQYTISKHSINNGGSKMTGGSYIVTSSIGQPDSSDIISASNYTLNGGFWQRKGTAFELVFSNGFEQ